MYILVTWKDGYYCQVYIYENFKGVTKEVEKYNATNHSNHTNTHVFFLNILTYNLKMVMWPLTRPNIMFSYIKHHYYNNNFKLVIWRRRPLYFIVTDILRKMWMRIILGCVCVSAALLGWLFLRRFQKN